MPALWEGEPVPRPPSTLRVRMPAVILVDGGVSWTLFEPILSPTPAGVQLWEAGLPSRIHFAVRLPIQQ